MTCIVGLVYNGHVYVGGDSAAVEVGGYAVQTRADEKVFQRGSYIMGFSGSFRMGQLLRYAGSLPDPPAVEAGSIELYRFMCTTFIDSVREIFKAGGFTAKETADAELIQGEFIVAVHGKLFAVHTDYQVAQSSDGFTSVGCGYQIALGALYASRGWADPILRVKLALEAAEKFSAGVRGPFLVLTDEK